MSRVPYPRHPFPPSARRTRTWVAIGLALLLVAGVLGLDATPAAAFNPAQAVTGINAGNGPELVTGPDGSNLAAFYDRDTKTYSTVFRKVGDNQFGSPITLPNPAGKTLNRPPELAILDDLSMVAASIVSPSNFSTYQFAIWRKTVAATSWTGPTVINLPGTGLDAFGASIAITPDGSVTWGWNDKTANQVNIARVAPGGSTVGAIQKVGQAGKGGHPLPTVGRGGATMIWWQLPSSNTTLTSFRTTPTGTFSTPVALPVTDVDDTTMGNFSAAVGNDGRAVMTAMARATVGQYHVIAWTRPKNGAWTDHVTINAGSYSNGFPSVGIAGDGSIVAAYEAGLNTGETNAHVEVTTKGPNPTDDWTFPLVVSSTSVQWARPVVAVGDDGSAIVAWDLWDGLDFDYGEPGSTYTSAHVTQVSYRTTLDGNFSGYTYVSARRVNDGNPAVAAGLGSVTTGWFESTHYDPPLKYGAMLASNGPAGVQKATLTVNSTTDRPATNAAVQGCKTGQFIAGKAECTLRAAIQTVNAGGGNAIDFDIATDGGEAPMIEVATKLPDVSKTVTIDGTSQAGGMVEVLGGATDGLNIAGAGSVVKGLAIAGFTGPAMFVSGAGTKVTGNRIGTDATGTAYRQVGSGIVVAYGAGITIGGDAAAEGNQIVTGADGVGVYGLSGATVPADNLKVRHNTIGLNAAGTAALGAGPTAAVLVAGDGAIKSTVSDNVVTGSKIGIGVFGKGAAGSTIASNTVGMNKARTARIGELTMGVRSDGAAGTSIASNAIGVKGWDVIVTGSVQGNFTSTTYQLFPPTSSKTTGTVTGGDEKVTGNLVGIFGNGTKVPGSGSQGITVWGGSERVLIQDNTVAGHSSSEISLIRGKDHKVLKNRIGVDPEGDAVLGATSGIVVTSSPGVTIGDSNTTGNRIGGASNVGILLNGTATEQSGGGKIVGNAFGLLADGVTPAANDGGIGITYGPKTTIGPDNVIANSAKAAISLSPVAVGTTVTGNRIGLNALGTAKAPNGVGILSSPPSGSDPSKSDFTVTGNTVSGSKDAGIVLFGGGAKVLLNRVGVSPTALTDLGNGGVGITVSSDGAEVRGNLVGFSQASGVSASGALLSIIDNQIGQPSGAETDIGNHGVGIAVTGSGKVTGNVVAQNGGAGIDLSSSAKVEVRNNRVAANGGAGISTVSGEGSIIRDNRIGLAAATDAARANDVGIRVNGGKVLLKNNRIGASTGNGINVAGGATATLTSNAIFGSGSKAIQAPTPIPGAPTVGFAVRKGTDDSARTWLKLTGPAAAGTFEAFGNADCSDPEAKVPMATGAWPGGTDAVVLTVRGRADLNGYTVTYTDTATGKTSELSTCATVDTAAADGDNDGIPSIVEAASPWTAAQGSANFVAVPSDNGGWIGMRDTDDPFAKVTPVDPPSGRPSGIELPFGMLSFEIKLDAVGFNTQVEIFTSGVPAGDKYWKFGSDEGKPAGWYRFDYRKKPAAVPGFFEETGAKKETFTVDGKPYAGYRIWFDDGLRGDDTTTKDGYIRDPGGGATGGVDDTDCPTAKGNARYVCRVYQYGLGRSPDPAGQAYWVRKLDGGTSRSAVMKSFISGSESRRTVVRRIFSAYLHRSPDPSGLKYWTDKLGSGTSPEALRVNLLSSSEHYRKAGGTNRDWANRLYAEVARRPPTDAELDALIALLDAGASRSSVATSMLRSTDGRATVVAQLYELYLERTPGSTETVYWQNKLANGMTELQLAISTVASNEFANK